MTTCLVTTDEIGRCLTALQQAAEPLTAIQIAARLQLQGARETRRRRVRTLIKQLRDSGVQIAASLRDGYLLSTDGQQWERYLQSEQIKAKQRIGLAHRRRKMVTDARGQGVLFG